jgi:hypothetical protein
MSVYDMRARQLGLQPAHTEFRFRGVVLEGLGGAAARQAADDLEQYARLGGMTLVARDSPWARSPIVSAEEARQADQVLDDVRRHTLPAAAAMLGRASYETGLPEPQALAGWAELIAAWTSAGQVMSAMTPAVYALDLPAACMALAPAGRGGAARLWAALTSSQYRVARTQLPGTARVPGPALAGGVTRLPRRRWLNARPLTSTCSASSPSWKPGPASLAWRS